MKYKTNLIITAFVLLSFSVKAQNPNQLIREQKKMIGKSIPTISFTDFLKNASPQTEVNNKYKVIEFWATWCKPCLDAVPHMNSLQNSFKNREDLVFLSVTYENPEKVSKTLANVNFETMVVSDQTKALHQNLKIEYKGMMVIPKTALVDKNNKVVWIGYPQDLNETMITRFLNREKL